MVSGVNDFPGLACDWYCRLVHDVSDRQRCGEKGVAWKTIQLPLGHGSMEMAAHTRSLVLVGGTFSYVLPLQGGVSGLHPRGAGGLSVGAATSYSPAGHCKHWRHRQGKAGQGDRSGRMHEQSEAKRQQGYGLDTIDSVAQKQQSPARAVISIALASAISTCKKSTTFSRAATHWALSAAAFASAARRSDDVTVSPVAVWKLKVLNIATMASVLFDGARVYQRPGSADRGNPGQRWR